MGILYHHRDERRYQTRCDQVIESGCYPPRVHVDTTVGKYQQTVGLLAGGIAVRSVNPNWSFIAEEFAGEFVAPHLSSRNVRMNDGPTLRLSGGQFDCRKGIPFVRVELVVVLGELEWIERVVSDGALKPDDASPLFRVREIRRELIDEARAPLKPKCFVPQVSVEQPRHRLT